MRSFAKIEPSPKLPNLQYIGPVSSKKYKLVCAPMEESDQPAHLVNQVLIELPSNICNNCVAVSGDNYRGGSRISGKGVHMYKGVGGSLC